MKQQKTFPLLSTVGLSFEITIDVKKECIMPLFHLGYSAQNRKNFFTLKKNTKYMRMDFGS